MKVQALGHVVIKVRNRERAERFYNGLLGIPIAARMTEPPMTFFSLGNHHDFAITVVGDDAPSAPERAPGLFHVAFKVGNTLDELREAKVRLEAAGLHATAFDHVVTQSLYVADPDGNTVELYVDGSDAWKTNPAIVASIGPLQL
jgi:catechol 2,3-dioxygenase